MVRDQRPHPMCLSFTFSKKAGFFFQKAKEPHHETSLDMLLFSRTRLHHQPFRGRAVPVHGVDTRTSRGSSTSSSCCISCAPTGSSCSSAPPGLWTPTAWPPTCAPVGGVKDSYDTGVKVEWSTLGVWGLGRERGEVHLSCFRWSVSFFCMYAFGGGTGGR